MTMQTDVKGASCAAGATTTAFNGRTRLKALTYSAPAAGTVAIKDGSTTLFTFTITAAGDANILIPGEGVLVKDSLVVTTSAGITAVAFYG